jgi:hypothetical protein
MSSTAARFRPREAVVVSADWLDVRSGSTASRLGIAANHVTAGVASKLPRNRRLRQERVILIDLSTRRAIMNENEAIPSSSAPRRQPWNKGKLIGAKATLIYRRTGNLRAVQLLLGHTKIESTVRYLGIEIDDAIEIAEKIEI